MFPERCNRITRALAPVLALALGLAGCATVPETERRQLLLVDPEREVRMGAQAFEDISEELDFVESGPQVDQLERIGERIAAQAGPRLEERGYPDLDWEFKVVDDDQLNAFVLPAGKVVFYTGLMDLADSDAEIASVMGHEVAHVLARHSGERLSQNVLMTTGLVAAQIGTSGRDPDEQRAIMAALGVGATVGVMLPFSRQHESEADRIGLTLMAEAGYDPEAAVSFWQKMADERDGGGPPTFLSTHPGPGDRITHLREHMPEARAIYEDNR